jgi:hypothetical protein
MWSLREPASHISSPKRLCSEAHGKCSQMVRAFLFATNPDARGNRVAIYDGIDVLPCTITAGRCNPTSLGQQKP